MSKICTGCDISKDKKSQVKKRAAWVKKAGRKKHPPDTYLPNPKNLISIEINMGNKYSGRYIYYFAAESKHMLQLDNKFHPKISPKKAYDDFENNGVMRLNEEGVGTIVLSKPVNYYVKEDKKKYLPHIHYKISSKDCNKWLQTNYTIQI